MSDMNTTRNELLAQIDKLKNEHAQMLQDTVDYYENILSLMPGHVYWLNKHNVYLGCNNEQASSAGLRSREDIVGKRNSELPWHAQAEALDKVNLEVLKTGIAQTEVETADTIDGQKIYLSQKVPLFNKKKEIIGLLGVSLDITELKNTQRELSVAKEQAEAALKAKTLFIANMSHDLRTPLSGIIGLSELMQQNRFAESEQQKYLGWMQDSAYSLLDMLNGVLSQVASDDANQQVTTREYLSVEALFASIEKLYRPALEQKKLAFQCKVSPGLIGIKPFTNAQKLHRILVNLVGNAIKFTESGQICLDADWEQSTGNIALGGTLCIAVQDSGIGIAKENLSKIFEQFFRVSPSFKGQHQGYGLGLYSVKSLIDSMDGRVLVDSTPGSGSRFTVELPIEKFRQSTSDNPFESASSKKTPTKNDASFAGFRVLVVEDNPVALKIMQNLCEQAHLQFDAVDNAEEALLLYQQTAYHLLITDIGLPGMSGHSLSKKIRQLEKKNQHPPMPIIGLTAHLPTEDNQKHIQAGMNELITKPITLHLFLEKLSHYLGYTSDTALHKPHCETQQPLDDELRSLLKPQPLLDDDAGLGVTGSAALLENLRRLFVSEELPRVYDTAAEAFAEGNVDAVQRIAHQVKSSALYCGAPRLKLACEQLEHYAQAGLESHIEACYVLFVSTLKETETALLKSL